MAAAGVVSLGAVAQAEEAKSTVQTALSHTVLSGYVNTALHWNPGNVDSQALYAFSKDAFGGTKDDGFNLNVIDITLEKPLDEGQWSAGYKAELWVGPDAATLGTDTYYGTSGGNFAIRNAYVSLRTPIGNGIDWKIGVWDTIIGYETQNAGENPNYTRSWGHTIEPTQHTGILGSYKAADWLSIAAGVANTTDARINGRVGTSKGDQTVKTYMGSVALTAPESFGSLKGATLYAGIVEGQPSGGAIPDRTWIYVGATVPTPLKGLTTGVAWDHLNLDGPASGAGGTHDTDVFAAYLSYQATEKLKVNGRLEYIYWGDVAGLSSAGPTPYTPGDEFLGVTVTADYALWANVISRVEYRWDHDLGRNGGGHFSEGNNEHLLALNVIYKF
ncbi:MAG TPA: outer membrane beta-barrel protein [Verrucomicrobiae bacterium]